MRKRPSVTGSSLASMWNTFRKSTKASMMVKKPKTNTFQFSTTSTESLLLEYKITEKD